MPGQDTKTNNIIKFSLQLVIVAVIFTVAFWLGDYVTGHEAFRQRILDWGYWGAFIFSALSGFNLLVPIPAISFLPAMLEAGLNFWAAIAVITLGMSLGDSAGFLIGKLGRQIEVFRSQKIMAKLEIWRERHYAIPVAAAFVWAAAVPLPNEIIVIPVALMGYKFRHLILAVILGNLIFNTYTAYGIINLFEALFK